MHWSTNCAASRRWPSAPPRSCSTTPRIRRCRSPSSSKGTATRACAARTTSAKAWRPSTTSAAPVSTAPDFPATTTPLEETDMNTTIRNASLPLALALASLAGNALAQAQPIRIGVVTPLSGTYAGIGQQVKWGLDLAARQINATGGVAGRPLELVYEDEEANPAVAVQKAEKLFQVNKVDFLTGTVNSGSTLAVGQLAERNNRLIATTVSFADSITADKCSANVFRVNARAG
eukprot:Opistho-2@46952